MAEAGGYRAFISYSHRDARWGEWLHRRLETYRIPKAIVGRDTPFGPIPERLAPIFRDRDELAAATDLSAEITAALDRALFLVVLCSPAAAQSKWVNDEIKTFKRLHGEDRVRAIIVDGAPFSGDPQTECFPEALRFRFRDGAITEEKAEPIAADLREGGDGKKYAISKLVAGLVGARLDDLVQRENARRAARMRAAVAGMSAVAASLGGLAVYAFQQRDVAVEARALAETERAEAQTAREGAEGLVEFMLTDLRKRLDAVGRLDVLDSVGKRALSYYDERDLGRADPDALGRRARAQLLVGEIDNLRGDFPAALAAYEAAAKTTEELLKRNPDDEQRIFDHAQSVYWVGDVALKKGDIATAKQYWTQYRDFGAQLVAINPDEDEWRTELAYGHRNLASLALDEGDASTAITGFRDALGISRELAEKHPQDRAHQLGLADDYVWLALALERHGAFSEAENVLLQEAEIHASLLKIDHADSAVLRRSAVNGRVRARIALTKGDAARAIEFLKSLFPLHESQLEQDAANVQWRLNFGRLQVELGNAYLTTNDHVSARSSADDATKTAAVLLGLDNSVFEWAVLSYDVLFLSARAALAGGDEQAARIRLAEAASILDQESDNIDGRTLAQLQIKAKALDAAIEERSGNDAAAAEIARDAIKEIPALVIKSGFENKTVFVGVLLLAGELSRAQALADSLDAAGYRHPDFMHLKKKLAAITRREATPLPNEADNK